MLRFAVILVVLFTEIVPNHSVAAVARRGNNSAITAVTSNSSGSVGTTTSARSGTRSKTGVARSATTSDATPNPKTNSDTHNTTSGKNVSQKSPQVSVRARSATSGAKKNQAVINSGTKVNSAIVAASDECQEMFYGCMDAFCMSDNESGGRCICSARIFELDKTAQKISAQNTNSYLLSTSGVEKIESGVPDSMMPSNANSQRTKVDLSSLKAPNKNIEVSAQSSEPEYQRGTALFQSSIQTCIQRMPQCQENLTFLTQMYSGRIRSDCAGYENALKEQQKAANEKTESARVALQTASLESVRNANKYDLGQCTLEFKNCMKTTAECGEDFTNCVNPVMTAHRAGYNGHRSDVVQDTLYSIKRATSSIDIYQSTFDILSAKAPMCEIVKKSCTDVSDAVFDSFLREAAPELKYAESQAEDTVRQSCTTQISDCFQKACKDNIDPNNPEDSYDLCLTRPETMLNLCRPQLTNCGVDATDKDTARNSQIWEYVVARLASMRVDSCTKEVKECLTAEDRCGADWSNCVGLSTDDIVRLCPYDKMVGCTLKYGNQSVREDAVYDALSEMVQGMMVNIDNSMLKTCQSAIDQAMINVCGSTDNCNNLAIANGVGGNSLQYRICTFDMSDETYTVNDDLCWSRVEDIPDLLLGRDDGSVTGIPGYVAPMAVVIDGTILWANIDFDDSGRVTDSEKYFKISKDNISEFTDEQKSRIKNELDIIQKNIDAVISAIESDPMVHYCMTGRDLPAGAKLPNGVDSTGNNVRFKNLTKFMRQKIATSALKQAKDNYYTVYDKMNTQLAIDNVALPEKVNHNLDELDRDKQREAARKACVDLAESSALAKTQRPPKSWVGTIIIAVVVVIAVVILAVYCAPCMSAIVSAVQWMGVQGGSGLATVAKGAKMGVRVIRAFAHATKVASAMANTGLLLAGSAGLATGTVAGGISAGVNALVDNKDKGSTSTNKQNLKGEHMVDSWDHREWINTEFDWESLKCTRCIREQICKKIKKPMFGRYSCGEWGKTTAETCNEIQF